MQSYSIRKKHTKARKSNYSCIHTAPPLLISDSPSIPLFTDKNNTIIN